MPVSVDEYLLKTAHELEQGLLESFSFLASCSGSISGSPPSPINSEKQFGKYAKPTSRGIFRYKKYMRSFLIAENPAMSSYMLNKKLVLLWERESESVKHSWNITNRTH
jgi:hypothetical protein